MSSDERVSPKLRRLYDKLYSLNGSLIVVPFNTVVLLMESDSIGVVE